MRVDEPLLRANALLGHRLELLKDTPDLLYSVFVSGGEYDEIFSVHQVVDQGVATGGAIPIEVRLLPKLVEISTESLGANDEEGGRERISLTNFSVCFEEVRGGSVDENREPRIGDGSDNNVYPPLGEAEPVQHPDEELPVYAVVCFLYVDLLHNVTSMFLAPYFAHQLLSQEDVVDDPSSFDEFALLFGDESREEVAHPVGYNLGDDLIDVITYNIRSEIGKGRGISSLGDEY